ncbi:hypothetical protein GCM10028784_25850 [Myceligenerans cantabricum]
MPVAPQPDDAATQIIAIGKRLLPKLPHLIGDAAVPMARELSALLKIADQGTPRVAEAIVTVLKSNPTTRSELSTLLGKDPEALRDLISGLPGIPHGAPARVYECPRCSYTWPIYEEGEPVPPCPNGHGRLG